MTKQYERRPLRERQGAMSCDVADAIRLILGENMKTPRTLTYEGVAAALYQISRTSDEGGIAPPESPMAKRVMEREFMYEIRERDNRPTSIMNGGIQLIEQGISGQCTSGDPIRILKVNHVWLDKEYDACEGELAALTVDDARELLPKRGAHTACFVAIRAGDPGGEALLMASLERDYRQAQGLNEATARRTMLTLENRPEAAETAAKRLGKAGTKLEDTSSLLADLSK